MSTFTFCGIQVVANSMVPPHLIVATDSQGQLCGIINLDSGVVSSIESLPKWTRTLSMTPENMERLEALTDVARQP